MDKRHKITLDTLIKITDGCRDDMHEPDNQGITARVTETTHNFGDCNGSVPAHKHPYGGGWVADTATVEDTVYVGEFAQVGGNAILRDKVELRDHAMATGDVVIGDHAQLRGKAAAWGGVVKQRAIIGGTAKILYGIYDGNMIIID